MPCFVYLICFWYSLKPLHTPSFSRFVSEQRPPIGRTALWLTFKALGLSSFCQLWTEPLYTLMCRCLCWCKTYAFIHLSPKILPSLSPFILAVSLFCIAKKLKEKQNKTKLKRVFAYTEPFDYKAINKAMVRLVKVETRMIVYKNVKQTLKDF